MRRFGGLVLVAGLAATGCEARAYAPAAAEMASASSSAPALSARSIAHGPSTHPALTSPAAPVVRTKAPSASVPPCNFGNVRSLHAPAAGWAHIVVDTSLRLDADFVPPDLVDTSAAGLNGGHLVRSIVIDDLMALAQAAAGEDAPLAVQSAYRSYATQAATFDHWVQVAGKREALRTSARPGHSEHQLGTAIDFRSAGDPRPPWTFHDWAQTDAGAWLAANAWKYGFVLSYPRGAIERTCYGYEPWHARYVGRRIAAAIHDSGLPPRAFLCLTGSD